MKKGFLMVAIASALSFNAFADADSVKENLKKVNNGRFASSNIQVLREVPVDALKGFYEATIDGQGMIVDSTGRYGIIGDLYDLDQMKNITQEKRTEMMSKNAKKSVDEFPEDNFVTYTPEKDVIGTLYVYTDPTCGYCKKLHSEMNQYMDAGVEVKYIPYPRGGAVEGQPGYEKTKQIMCAENPSQAMTEIKGGSDAGKFVKASYDEKCVDLVDNGVKSGGKVGFSGTPFLYLSTGQSIPGYQPASAVIKMLSK